MKVDSMALQFVQRYATTQGGVITASGADGLGVSRDVRHRLIEEGTWRRLTPGVFAVSPDSWLQRAWAGVLIGGPEAVLGGEAALALSGLAPEPQRVPVFIGRRAGCPDDRRWRFVRATRTGSGLPPRTGLPEAIIDVGGQWRPDDLLTLIGSAVSGRQTTPEDLRAELGRRTRQRQRGLISALINEVEGGTTTVLEHHYRRDVELPHGLPPPLRQAKPIGTHRVDNYYEKFRLIIEVDGRATHVGLAAAVDMRRDNDHMAHGISTLRFTWTHVVREPCQTARTVAAALTRAGWTGRPRLCPRCPR
ncbi:MAG: type IV toxin-antitoxin system AbiEi family antitoxin domain-containing protein [Propionibacteriaceae bacterium]|nr:type IV toxin-antitoxin system AbiEi family antitoxin domain-containing protein [Propionibacteriaceae bacterium]